MEISPEEVRFALMCGDMKEVLDNFWIGNYVALCAEMDLLESDARIESVSNRYVDPRENPDAFMAPFDVDRVLGTIKQVREQGARSLQKGHGDAQRGDRNWAGGFPGSPHQYPASNRGGYKDKGNNWNRQETNPGNSWSQGNNKSGGTGYGGHKNGYNEKEPRGFSKESAYSKGKDNEYRQKNTWGYPRNTGRRHSKPDGEFDIQDVPSSFSGPYGGVAPKGTGGTWAHNGEALGDRQGIGRGSGDEEFIEEDFEYGKVPYSYRKPSK